MISGSMELKADPVEQFALWFGQACDQNLLEPNAMSLATAGTDGRVAARLVLLKKFDARGFVFFTNLNSKKSIHIAQNNRVSLLFPWLALGRQVIVQGAAEKIPASETLAYFVTRPFGSRLGAWVSRQSSIITSRKLLEMQWEEMKRKFSDGQVPLPSFWGGYRVKPHELEFWQYSADEIHDRFLYTRESGGWKLERLAP
jgi:pyridoxamine 5'-phosphate oxidase